MGSDRLLRPHGIAGDQRIDDFQVFLEGFRGPFLAVLVEKMEGDPDDLLLQALIFPDQFPVAVGGKDEAVDLIARTEITLAGSPAVRVRGDKFIPDGLGLRKVQIPFCKPRV